MEGQVRPITPRSDEKDLLIEDLRRKVQRLEQEKSDAHLVLIDNEFNALIHVFIWTQFFVYLKCKE